MNKEKLKKIIDVLLQNYEKMGSKSKFITQKKEIELLQGLMQKLDDVNTQENDDKWKSNINKTDLDEIAEIAEYRECAYQRAIFNLKEAHYNDNKIKWIDYEVPVIINNNARRKCIDLIGNYDNEGKQVICELKYTSNDSYHSNNPYYSIVELLLYAYFVDKNKEKLMKYDIHHKNCEIAWEKFTGSNTSLIVMANKDYWKYWLKRLKREDLENFVKKIRNDLEVSLDLLECPNPNKPFNDNKISDVRYKPEMGIEKIELTNALDK